MLSDLKAVIFPKTKTSGTHATAVDAFFPQGRLAVEKLDPLPVDLSYFPDGWMTPLELQVLYNFGKYANGDFLEIGTWIGRSTTAIALGRRDAASSSRRFDAVDFGFVSLHDFCKELSVGMEYASGDEIARPILGHGGSIAYLIENLRKRGLLGHVTSVVRGNAIDVPLRDSYGAIFCDAVHTEREIEIVGPTLSRISRPGTWLICDDIHNHEHLVSALGRYVQFDSFELLANIDPQNKVAVGRVQSTAMHSA
jgi:hypothetical protein